MKFIQIYNLICEDRIDNLISKDASLEKYKDLLKEIYNSFDLKTQSNAKFNKFLEFLLKNAEKLEEYKDKMKDLYLGYIKYNLDLSKYNLESLWKYVEDKENISKLVIDPTLAKKIYEDDEKIVIMPLNREGSIKYGSPAWCTSKPNNEEWYNYLVQDGKLMYFVLYKTSKAINIPGIAKDNTGIERNFKITAIQIDLNNKFYITDTGNTVQFGLINQDANKILEFMELNKKIFKSFKDPEIFKLIIDNDKKIFDNINKNSAIYNLAKQYYPNEIEIKELNLKFIDACYSNNLEIVKKLLKNSSIDVNSKDTTYHNTALMYACVVGALNIVKELMKSKELDINVKNKQKVTAFMYACKYESLNIVKELLKRKDLDINAKDNNNINAFTYACQSNNLNIIKELLEDRRFDVNSKDNEFFGIIDLRNDKTKKLIDQYKARYNK